MGNCHQWFVLKCLWSLRADASACPVMFSVSRGTRPPGGSGARRGRAKPCCSRLLAARGPLAGKRHGGIGTPWESLEGPKHPEFPGPWGAFGPWDPHGRP
eukprot:2616826-Pyramimonas_sp.AAC.1